MMQNLSFHDTEGRTDYTRGGIRERNSDRPPIESPVSKSTIITEIFQTVLRFTPHPNIFPLFVKDWRVASRAKEILGLPQDKPWGKGPYRVFGLEVYKWLDGFEKIIGRQFIDAAYIVGSSALYVAGQPLLREALDVFFKHIPDNYPNKYNLFVKLVGKIAKKTFSFADVDLRIKVKSEVALELLQKQINEMKGCRTELFNGKLLLILIEDENGNALDVAIYNELETECAFNLDDFKVNIYDSQLDNNFVSFNSVEPWNCSLGHTLGVLEDRSGGKASDKFRVFPRLLWQLSKCKITIQPTVSCIFPKWIQKINSRLQEDKTALRTQFEKHQANHDRHIPLANCFLRLLTQQLIIEYSPDSKLALREAGNIEIPESAPWFVKAIFTVMQDKEVDIPAIHALIECIALLALYEAWQKPFEVKLVKHDGKWVLRIRFRGSFGKRDLLVRFDVSKSLNVFKAIPKKQWKKLRVIVHSLMTGEIEQREMGKNYKKLISNQIQQNDISTIRRKLLEKTGLRNDNLTIASQPSLAQLELSWSQKAKYLLEVGKIVFNHYHFNLAKRRQLCWDVVNKCIDYRGYTQAAEMIDMLREEGEEPPNGYPSLFAHVLNKNVDSSLLYKACNPFHSVSEESWMLLAQKQDKLPLVQKMMNESDISAELFLELVHLLKMKAFTVSEKILCKLIAHDKKNACKLIMERDDLSFNSLEYTKLVSICILENLNTMNPYWIKNYLFSKRFVGSLDDKEYLSKQLLQKPIVVQDKAAILKLFEIKEKTLWQIIANEYISLGEKWPEAYNKDSDIDYESLVLWHEIIERADDTGFVEEALLKIKTKDSIRGLVLVQLLKNWGKRKVAVEILKKLDLSKKPIAWNTVLASAETGADILRNLNNVSLPLYSALLRAIRPKETFYVSWWVKMMEEKCPGDKLLPELQKPLMIDCLQIHPLTSLPLYKKVANTQEGVLLALNTLKDVDEELLYALIKTCQGLKDRGAAGARVVLELYDSKKHPKTIEFTQHLRILANTILMNPQGDIDAVIKIKKTFNKETNPDQLPCKEQLVRLIRNNHVDWVIEMLNKATIQELNTLPSEFYCFLINSCKDIDKRCVVIEICPLVSTLIQKKWETLAQTEKIDIFSSVRLLQSAQRLKISNSKVQECAFFVLSNNANHNIEINDVTLKYLLEMIPTMELERGYKLWTALSKIKRIEKIELFETAIELLNRNPLLPHYCLLNWVLQNVSEKYYDKVLELVTKILQYPVDERIQKIIIKWLKKETINNNDATRKLYWKLDCDDGITHKEIERLKPTHEEYLSLLDRFIEKSKKEKLSSSMLGTLRYLCSKNEEFLNRTLESINTNTLEDMLSTKLVFDAHRFPEHIERFQTAIDSIKDSNRKRYFNTLLLSAKLIETPTTNNALSFINHLDAWDDSNDDLMVEEIEQWREMLQEVSEAEDKRENHLLKQPIHTLFFVFICHNFIKTKQSVYFEPKVLKRFFDMLLNRSKKSSFLLISSINMLLRSIRTNCNVTEADQVLKFIFGSDVLQNERNIEDYAKLIVNIAEIITENEPILGKWNRVCVKYLMVNVSKLKYKNLELFNESYKGYLALRGDVGYEAYNLLKKSWDNFSNTLPDRPHVAVTKAIQLLCSTHNPENHYKAEMLLTMVMKDIQKFQPENFKICNLAYIRGVLNFVSDDSLFLYLSHLFSYIIPKDPSFQETLHLELIYTNVFEIVRKKPHLLPIIIDFLNSNILSVFSKSYRTNLEYYQNLLRLLYSECENAQSKSLPNFAIAFEKLGILIQTHPYVNADFIEDLIKNNEIRLHIAFALVHCHGFKLALQNPVDLLTFKTTISTENPKEYSMQDIFKLELCLKHLWCFISTEFQIGGGFENELEIRWFSRIKEEFITCFLIASHLPRRGALILNILSTFEKVIEQIKDLAQWNSDYANCWIASFINKLSEKMGNNKPWFMLRVLEIIGKNMTRELLPCLDLFEKFYANYCLPQIKPVCIEAYYAILKSGCSLQNQTVLVQQEIIQKAVKNSGDLLKKIKFKTDDVNFTYGYDSLYLDDAFENTEQFQFVYLSGFSYCIEMFKLDLKKEKNSELPPGKSVEIFMEEIRLFRSYTDIHLKKCRESNEFPLHQVKHINCNLQYLTNKNVFHELMSALIYHINNFDDDYCQFGEIQISILLLAIFYGPVNVIVGNNFLADLEKKYKDEIACMDVSIICNEHGDKAALKWYILENTERPTNFGASLHQRAISDPQFMQSFEVAMNEVIKELERFKEIQPEQEIWYNEWKIAIESKIIAFKSSSKVLYRQKQIQKY